MLETITVEGQLFNLFYDKWVWRSGVQKIDN